jgi:hypothetical protein
MATKHLTETTLQLVKDEIRNYRYHIEERDKVEYLSANWFKHTQQANGCYALIQTITGLTMTRVERLLNGIDEPKTHWLPSGRKKA